MIEFAAVFAVAGAASNAMGTAFQRKAASTAGKRGLRLLGELVRRPAWAIGMAGVIGAALFQSLALVNGPLSLVQPLFILELPFALLIAAPLMHRRLPARGWWGVSGVVTGLALVLASLAPHGARDQAPLERWLLKPRPLPGRGGRRRPAVRPRPPGSGAGRSPGSRRGGRQRRHRRPAEIRDRHLRRPWPHGLPRLLADLRLRAGRYSCWRTPCRSARWPLPSRP